MKQIVYFYRKKNPAFFSIEQVFQRIAAGVAAYGDLFEVREVSMPRPSKLANLIFNIRWAGRQQADINHITGDVHYALMGLSRNKINLLTVHDCVLLRRLSRKDPRFWLIKWLWHEWPIRRADVVTVISESTKRDLLHFTNTPPEKIRVIPNFIDPVFQPAEPRLFRDCPLILFVGTTENKNLDRLAEAMQGMAAELDIIGVLSEPQKECLKKYGVIYRQCAGISREELLKHYHDADIVAFPSTYEGFGLPVIEGQAVGKPVLTSAIPPMKDIAGEGACLVDPYDVASIRSGLMRIIGEKEYRERLRRSGLVNAAKYSLGAIVDSYVALYRELLAERNNHLSS